MKIAVPKVIMVCKIFKRAYTCYMNILLVPVIKNESATDKVNKWNFDRIRHLVDYHGSISRKEVLLWTEDNHLQGDVYDEKDLKLAMELSHNSRTQLLLSQVEGEMDELKTISEENLYSHMSCSSYFCLSVTVLLSISRLVSRTLPIASCGLTRCTCENFS